MNGLEISRAFFDQWGLPYLQQHSPALVDRVAAGLFDGSQIYGADDELSRDHGWGPHFLLILTDDDYATSGAQLKAAINAAAPRQWAGYELLNTTSSVLVESIESFFQEMTGFAHPPADPEMWLATDYARWREAYLYRVRHGHLFHDPLGEFSARCEEFRHFPHVVWLARVCEEVFRVWHYGQYNFVERLARRQDAVSIQIALGYFVEAVMRLCLLLEHDYTPYWKWLAFEFRRRPAAAFLDPPLRALAESDSVAQQAEIVGQMCEEVRRLLEQAGLPSKEPAWHPHPLLRYRQAIWEQVERERVLARSHP